MLTKKIIDGEAALAFRKTSRTARSDSPRNLFRSCGVGRSSRTRSIKCVVAHLRSFDRNEVKSAFTGAGSHKDRLAAARGSIQQDPFRWPYSKSLERLWVEKGPFDGLAQFLNHMCLATNVRVTDGWRVEEKRSHSGWSDRWKSCKEV
jgi:hypothetical protein